MIRISSIGMEPIKSENIENTKQRLLKKLLKLLRISEKEVVAFKIQRKSIDARKKDSVKLVFSVDLKLSKETEERLLNKKIKNLNLTRAESVIFNPVIAHKSLDLHKRIYVVGAGPAGLFAAYMLSINGYKPVLLERGYDVDRRQKSVDEFWKGEGLDTLSNVQFGEGGAGTFSDGKLNTGVKDPEGRIQFVLETLVKMGAKEDILYEQKPHVGTDVLKNVVKNLRKAIIENGGQVRFEACVTDIIWEEDTLKGIWINGEEYVPAEALVLAIGHSARDTFEMLHRHKLNMQAKDFAVGFRVIHPQKMINESQYGEIYADYFEAASYKLTAKSSDNRGVYSFCMCPGGYVVNASSEAGHTCVNGMSYSGRDSSCANSAIIVAVKVQDFIDELSKAGIEAKQTHPLLGMYFQRLIEKRTYEKSPGKIPVQYYGEFKDASYKLDFKEMECSPDIKGEYMFTSLRNILPTELENAFIEGMESMGKKIKGFNASYTILAGTESRTSSPVRIHRDENGMSSVKGLYPCGEGAGYAGGITSAAVDGLRIAEKIIKGIENA